jgi:O-antigen/teichoic acid export membrane protein
MPFLSAGLWIAAARLVARGALLVAAVLASRALDPAEFGAYAYVLAYLGAASLVGGLGLEQTAMISVARARAHGGGADFDRAVGRILVRALPGAAGVALIVAALCRTVLASPTEIVAVAVVAAVVCVVAAGFLRGLDRPVAAAVVLEGGRGAACFAGAVSLHLGVPATEVWTVTAIAALCVLAATVATVVGAWFGGRTGDAAGSGAAAPEAVAGQGTFLAVVFATNLYLWLVPIVLERAGPVEEVGKFNVAMQLPALVSFLSTSLEMALLGRIAAAHATGRIGDLQPLLRSAARLVSLVVLPAAAALALFREPALALFGDGYRDTATAMGLAIAAQVVSVACGPAGYIVLLTGRERLNMAVMAGSSLAGLAVVVLAAPAFGHVAAAAGFLVSIAAANLVLAWICVTRLGIDPTLRAAFEPRRTEGHADAS